MKGQNPNAPQYAGHISNNPNGIGGTVGLDHRMGEGVPVGAGDVPTFKEAFNPAAHAAHHM